MKITIENYEEYIPEKDMKLFYSLLMDLEEFNNKLDTNNLENKKLYIDYQDFHNNYSCERTDPCPDYYGYYRLKFEEDHTECVGTEMTIDDLDNALCVLINFIDF